MGPTADLAASVRLAVGEIDPTLQVSGFATVKAIVDQSTIQERFVAQLASFFSTFALMLAAIGL